MPKKFLHGSKSVKFTTGSLKYKIFDQDSDLSNLLIEK